MCEEIEHQYSMVRKLGEGGFGKVFLVTEKKTGRHFAVKVVSNMEKADREASILLGLNHPCVIRTFDYGCAPQKLFLLLDYMQGGDLTRYVNRNRLLTPSQTKLIFYQLTLAVQYLHEKHIVHRDLKPDNVLLATAQPCTLIKVTDFGLAKDEYLHSLLQSGCGTPQYFAPEILQGRQYTKKVDIYSMGVILHLSLCGEFPSVRNQQAFPQDVPESARELVRNMVTTGPERRLDISQVLRSPWLQDDQMKLTANILMRRVTAQEPVEKLTLLPSTASSSETSDAAAIGIFVGAIALVAALGTGAIVSNLAR